jgi:hypothetical protein
MALTGAQRPHEVFEAVIQVVPDQGILGLLDRFLNGLQLLSDIQAGTSLLQHFYGAAQVSAGSAKAFDDGWVGGMCVRLRHG